MNPIIQKTHNQKEKLTLENSLYKKAVYQYTFGELKKDLSGGRDITTRALFGKDKEITGVILAKQSGILAGMQELKYFLKAFPKISAVFFKNDGDKIFPGKIAKFDGSLFDIFKMERAMLNLLGRMSGVATSAHEFAKKAPKALVVPTRKTLWGLLDKRACVLGGCGTHRLSLKDAVLIKDNHINAFNGDIFEALKNLQPPKARFIEIEVNAEAQAVKAAKAFIQKHWGIPCFIMFDNVSAQEITKTISKIKSFSKSKIFFEASGNINPQNIEKYAKTGVSIISIGALTHSAKNFDFSFEVVRREASLVKNPNFPSDADERGK